MTNRILYSWEIGSGNGHVRNLAAVSDGAKAAGFESHFALSISNRSQQKFVSDSGNEFSTFHAPMHPSLLQWLPAWKPYRAASFLDVLTLHAFSDSNRFRMMLKQSVEIIERVDPVLIVAESSPVFLFAARLLDVPVLAVGTSFGLPNYAAGLTPYARLDPGEPTPLMNEKELSKVVIDTLGSDAPDMPFSSMFAPAASMPFCFPSLDHYGAQRGPDEQGIGPVARIAATGRNSSPNRQLFAYLSGEHPKIKQILSAIRLSGIPTRAFVKGNRLAVSSGNLIVLDEFDVKNEIESATEIMHHGSAGIGQIALQAGIPQMCFPFHIENTLNSFLLQNLGVSKAVGHGQEIHYPEFMLDGVDMLRSNATDQAESLSDSFDEFPGASKAVNWIKQRFS